MFGLFGFERQVATRFLREGRMQTVLIIVGVAAGVAVVAYISALITGLQRNTLEKTLGAQAHMTISTPDDVVISARTPDAATAVLSQTQPRAQRPRSIANWRAMVPVLEAMPEMTDVSPTVSGAGLAVRGEATKSISLIGVELERYDRIVHLSSKIVVAKRAWGQAKASSDESWPTTWASA